MADVIPAYNENYPASSGDEAKIGLFPMEIRIKGAQVKGDGPEGPITNAKYLQGREPDYFQRKSYMGDMPVNFTGATEGKAPIVRNNSIAFESIAGSIDNIRTRGRATEKVYHVCAYTTVNSAVEVARFKPTGLNNSGSIIVEVFSEAWLPGEGAAAHHDKIVFYRNGNTVVCNVVDYMGGSSVASHVYAWDPIAASTTRGNAAYDFLRNAFSASDGTVMGQTYSYNTPYISLKVINMPGASTANPVMVRVTIKITGCNHKIWFRNKSGAFVEPIIPVVGDSLVEAIAIDTATQPNHIWTDIRGYLNYGIGGQTSAQILERVPDVISANSSATHVIVQGGINDCWMYISDPVTNPVPTIDNLVNMVTLVKNAGKIPIVMISPPYNGAMVYANRSHWAVGSAFYNLTLDQHLQIQTIAAELMQSLKKWCIDNKVMFIDAFDFMLDSYGRFKEEWSYEGLHFNLNGYMNWAEFANYTEGY